MEELVEGLVDTDQIGDAREAGAARRDAVAFDADDGTGTRGGLDVASFRCTCERAAGDDDRDRVPGADESGDRIEGHELEQLRVGRAGTRESGRRGSRRIGCRLRRKDLLETSL